MKRRRAIIVAVTLALLAVLLITLQRNEEIETAEDEVHDSPGTSRLEVEEAVLTVAEEGAPSRDLLPTYATEADSISLWESYPQPSTPGGLSTRQPLRPAGAWDRDPSIGWIDVARLREALSNGSERSHEAEAIRITALLSDLDLVFSVDSSEHSPILVLPVDIGVDLTETAIERAKLLANEANKCMQPTDCPL